NLFSFYVDAQTWNINTTQSWRDAVKQSSNLTFSQNSATLTNIVSSDKTAMFSSKVQRYAEKRQAEYIVFEQSHDWHNWTPTEHVGPTNLRDAPVFLSKGKNDYWMFGRYGESAKKNNFQAQEVVLSGYDITLRSTPFKHQYDAPGGLNKSLGGYHAWQSKDMVNWVHHGAVSEAYSRWVTSAEYVDGNVYIFYDYPNDQDPHMYIDEDLTDGVPGKDVGMVFNDPTHGSDSVFFHDNDGSLHVIYEDWSPINAQMHAWDSPLAGHAVSKKGYDNFEILPPAVDLRTTPTGKVKTYNHPHWKQHPAWDSNVAEFQEHTPVQDAFGDWCMIKIGEQYYLFGDYDKAEHSVGNGNPRKEAQANMSIARFTTGNLNEEFKLVGDFGKTGHPDPDIGFAEGKFYLITQHQDFVSSGPWVDTVSARVGVDIDNDGEIDQWSEWQKVSEQYQQKKGYAKHVERIPAKLDLSRLPPGYGFSFEFRANPNENGVSPVLDTVSLSFK
ncbi:glycoside hydrolase family protein, partial [Aliiglaciecola lipolytica]|uniref:hypothetical protein n=1 Tax=Aliiglaciecola lipolytica TaxID=477689 RepID=UPI00068FE3E5